MIISDSGGLSYLTPPPLSSDTVQQHLLLLSPPDCLNMQTMGQLLAQPPNHHQQQHMGLSIMMDDSFGMGPPQHHPLMHPSNRQSLLNIYLERIQ
jgi:hypothetical protein